jgi:hypothetical protein
VDILVVMAARNVTDQAIRIRQAVQAPFPMDLIVRTPQYVAWGLQEGDWFLREIVSQGKVLYEKGDKAVGAKSRRRLSNSAKAARGKNPAPLPNLLPLSAHAGRPSSDPLFCRQPVDGPPLC